MEIQCTDKKTFELTDGARRLGHISYDSLFTHNAVIVTGSDRYEINAVGIFSSTISVSKNGLEVANMQMSWKGDVVISLQNMGEFILKASGLFKSNYVLEDVEKRQLFLLTPDFNWKKFSYSYTISYDTAPKDFLVVLLAVYSANYYIAAMSGV